MANDTALVRLLQQYSNAGTNSTPLLLNHAPPDWLPPTPAQSFGPRRLFVPTTGVTIGIGTFVSIQNIIVANRDTVNVVEFGFTYISTATGTHANVIPIQPGAAISVNGPISTGTSLTLTALVATVGVDFSIIGT